jgi:chromosome segregation ATPase
MLHALLDAERKKNKEVSAEVDKLIHDSKLHDVELKTSEENSAKLKKEMEKLIDTDRIQRGLLENEIKDMRTTIHEQREKINSLDAELLELQRKKPEESGVTAEEVERLKQDNNNLLDELRQNMEELLKMEELESLKPQIDELKKENSRLRQEVEGMKGSVEAGQVELKSDDERIEHLQEGLMKAGSQHDKLTHKIEVLQREKRDLQERLKKKDGQLEEKDLEVQKALETLEQLKANGKKSRAQVDKVSREKEEIAKRLDRVLSDFTALKKAKDELQDVFYKMQEEFQGMKDTIGKKDEWILKQSNDMKVIAEQYAALKKKHADFRMETELEFGKVLSDKNTEILVLREMIKSTKAMVRAKDVDLARLKRKAQQSDSQPPLEEDRILSTAPKSMIGRKPLPGAKTLMGAKTPVPGLTKGKAKAGDFELPQEDNERPVYKLVRSIEDKKQVTVKRSPADIRRMLDDEEPRGLREAV